MKVMEDNFKEHFRENTYIALGSFDGLHLGHMRLINTDWMIHPISSRAEQ